MKYAMLLISGGVANCFNNQWKVRRYYLDTGQFKQLKLFCIKIIKIIITLLILYKCECIQIPNDPPQFPSPILCISGKVHPWNPQRQGATPYLEVCAGPRPWSVSDKGPLEHFRQPESPVFKGLQTCYTQQDACREMTLPWQVRRRGGSFQGAAKDSSERSKRFS